MNLRLLPLLLSATLAVLPACTMAPRYARPASPVPSAWPAAPGSAPAPASAPSPVIETSDLGWREFFSDRNLQDLIATALRENRDLRVAALNVEMVAAQYRIQRAALFPSLSANGSLDRSRVPNVLVFPGEPNPVSIYSVTAGVSSWELDLFGRVRSLKEKALQAYFAQEQNRRDVQLTLVAQVATEYFTERAFAEEMAIARETLRAQEDSLRLTQRAYEVGSSSALDFRTAQAQVASARSDLASLARQHAQSIDALAVLVGQPLPAAAISPGFLADDELSADLPPGLPSDLLDRRPDVIEAEDQLKSYNANIGAARAAFFPRITLTASGGTESLNLSGLFKPGSQVWSFNPQIALPIFDAGTNLANLDMAKIGKLTAAAQYEKAIQTAFAEVADALTARSLYEDQIAAQRALVDADQGAYTLAEARYRHGVDSYLAALDAQRSLYAAQQSLVQARLARLVNLATLYRALGGGWSEHTRSEAAAAN